ncbi:BTAD domain-containing putative transcriptional regulator [Kitasatospora sp. NPDC059812]|uniref:AfsR/SARP family transcriptional regulator n=1 Tax=Kitasatospora sp. NPDC059812 TaxID=3346958 RepID=UPI00365D45D4
MEFRILGSLEVWAGAAPVRLGGRRQRSLLAMLVAHSNRTVPVARLVDTVWDQDPPATADRQIRNMVGLLRRMLGTGAASPIVTDGAGYRLVADDARVDHRLFASRVAAAADLDAAQAVPRLREALELWRGPALDGLPGLVFAALATGLEEQRMAVLERLYELELEAGRHREVAAELTGLVADFPLRDRLVRQLLTALHRSGRHGDGLEAYRRHASRLSEDLGLDPTPEAQALQRALLLPCPAPTPSPAPTARPTPTARPDRTAPTTGAAPAAAPADPRPEQLPSDLSVFVGRAPELLILDRVLATGEPGARPTAAPCAVITGAAGVGKSVLALHWAHLTRERFPDGRLFADLRGWSAAGPRSPHGVLAAFLRALGVTAESIPAQLDEASALYRSLLAGRRMLVVLDDAAGPEHVRPLLPGGSGCAVVITSRDRLTGLVAREGAHRVALDGFTPTEGQALLARILGADTAGTADTAEAQRQAGARLLDACGHLPLALGIAAAQLRDRPQRDLVAFADELASSTDRLGALEADGDDRSSLRSAFGLSYQALDPAARRLFRRLGLFPGVDISAPVAATLSAYAVDECDRLLGRLTTAHLLAEPSRGRYRFHDLLKLFAAELGAREESPEEQRELHGRWHAWCLHHAHAAARVLTPGRRRVPLGPPPEGLRVADLTGPEQATRWCDDQRANLLATVRHAHERGDDETAWKLPALLWSYLHRASPQTEGVALGRTAVAAARRLGDLSAQAHGLNDLGHVWGALGELTLSRRTFQRARGLAHNAGDRCAEGRALANLGAYHYFTGHYADAGEYYEQALDLLTADGPETDDWTADLCRTSLAPTYLLLGRYQEASDHASRVLARPRAQRNGPMDCSLLNTLAAAQHALGRPEEAVGHYERSLAVSSRLTGYPAQRAHALAGLAAAHRALGREQRSRQAWDAAHEIYAELPAHQLTSNLPILAALGFTPPATTDRRR